MLAGVTPEYIRDGERGYCADHADVISGAQTQVVDRAVKQLCEALQSNGFELDGTVLKCGNGWLRYDDNASAWQYSNNAGVAWRPLGEGIIGEIRLMAHNTLPVGWLLCDGQPVLRSSPLGVLFAALNFPYGAGDGSTTCNLPDLRDLVPLGAGMSHDLGETGGHETITLTANELPQHSHALSLPYASTAGTSAAVMRGGASEGSLPVDTNTTGSGKSLNILPPYLGINFIIFGGV